MAGILVYLPGECQPPEIEFPLRGLASLLDRAVDAIPTPCPKGPDGGAGVLVTFVSMASTDTPREYDGDLQEWLCAPPEGELAGGRYWVGCVKNARPGPAELQRAEIVDGEPAKLRDGQSWLIPVSAYVPHLLTLNPLTGEEMRVPDDAYMDFVRQSNELFAHFLSQGFQSQLATQTKIHIPNGFHYAAVALAQNYRVNKAVLALLKLVGEWEATQIATIATSLKLFNGLNAQKKNGGVVSL